MLIGILGFFTVMAFIAAVAGIVRGEPGVTESLVPVSYTHLTLPTNREV